MSSDGCMLAQEGVLRQLEYEIRVEGHLGQVATAWFEGLAITLDESGETVLQGPLDQAALYGILMRIRDLGLTLNAVQRIHRHGVGGAAGTPWGAR
jgi:hypothetical protein